MRKLFLAACFVFVSATAFAQPPASACDGSIAIVRVSEIKPGGSISGFMAAMAAHKAWYRANGVSDNDIYAARVLVRDEKAGTWSNSEKQILSYHVNPPANSRTPKRGDAAWNAYVKMYQDNSDIKTEMTVCLPKGSK